MGNGLITFFILYLF